jgi:predicted GNAT family N-acyltransferase
MAEGIRIQLGVWAEVRALAAPIRFAVFVEEQKVPAAIELDEHDAVSLHALAFDARASAVGTGRLLPDGHIGRMAVLAAARGGGVGSALLRALMDSARARGQREVMLSAQLHAVPFYRRHGFVAEGSVYREAGIAHVDMRCPL